MTSLCLSLILCKVSHPSSNISLSILQSLVAPVIVLAASIWIATSFFFVLADELSQTESQYSKSCQKKEMYICSRDLRLILNLRAPLSLILPKLFHIYFQYDQSRGTCLRKLIPSVCDFGSH